MTTANHSILTLTETALEAYATASYADGRIEDAATALEALVTLDPERADAWALLGVVHRRKKDLPKALRALKRAVDLDDSDRYALLNLGEALCEAKRPKEGVALLRAVVEQGLDADLAPEQHDPMTIRAGAMLEAIQLSLRAWISAHPEPPTGA